LLSTTSENDKGTTIPPFEGKELEVGLCYFSETIAFKVLVPLSFSDVVDSNLTRKESVHLHQFLNINTIWISVAFHISITSHLK
jgi:hypothetical protein